MISEHVDYTKDLLGKLTAAIFLLLDLGFSLDDLVGMLP